MSVVMMPRSTLDDSTIQAFKAESQQDSQLNQLIMVLNQVVDALGEFKNRYDKKFNFTRLL